jgi:16S rRNA (uracil1498-N3)-methyltransferase
MKNRFLSYDKWEVGHEVFLSPEESHHLARVARLSEGEEIELINGQGALALATITSANAKKTQVKIKQMETAGPSSGLIIAFAIPKAAACDFIFHRCTELGVLGFQPILSAHSLHPKEWNQQRWERIIAEVCKQCQEVHFPKLYSPCSLADWLPGRDKEAQLVYCSEEERIGKMPTLEKKLAHLLIGAEGGWNAAEIDLFRAHGGYPLGLGKNRLRAETAALVAATLTKKLLSEI